VRFTENQVLNIIQEETKGCIREFVALGSEGPDGMVMLKTRSLVRQINRAIRRAKRQQKRDIKQNMNEVVYNRWQKLIK